MKPQGSRARGALRDMFNTLGYSLARKDEATLACPSLPPPSEDMVERAASYFANCFPISPKLGMSEAQIAERLKDYTWHYPFKFGDLFVDADQLQFKGLHGRHYQRYLHIFPALLSMVGGSLSSKTVLEIGCNAGFWCIQARRAGARSVLGLEADPKNVEQANLILNLSGMDGIEYRAMNAYDVSREAIGEFDVTFFLGLLYHIDKPIEALERMYEVTKSLAVIDTTVARSDVRAEVPILKLQEDAVGDQYFSNRLALVPSKSAVPLMLKHAGFREVFWVPNASRNLPLDYLTDARATFIAVK
jgi:2-polyprenyl-3-methyl-5-hydroxy-6-metoxy-1,4-benzoquinol methylase